MLKGFLLFSLVGLVLLGFVFSRADRKPEPTDIERAAPTVGADGVTHVGSIRLWQDYEANEVAADDVYKGKPVRVTGRALAVEKNMMGAATIDMTSGNAMFRTVATLTTDDTPRAAAISKGDTVVVECVGGGKFFRMPMLERCSLLRPE